jgi:hypothetical protein
MALLDILFGKKSRKEKKDQKASSPKKSKIRMPQMPRYRKQKIPAALRQQVWIQRAGRVFEHKCMTTWCSNVITVFDFECGHNIPESKGGQTNFENLVPICRSCNMSMSNSFTFDEWCITHNPSAIPPTYIEQAAPKQTARGRPRKIQQQPVWCVPMFHMKINPQG